MGRRRPAAAGAAAAVGCAVCPPPRTLTVRSTPPRAAAAAAPATRRAAIRRVRHDDNALARGKRPSRPSGGRRVRRQPPLLGASAAPALCGASRKPPAPLPEGPPPTTKPAQPSTNQNSSTCRRRCGCGVLMTHRPWRSTPPPLRSPMESAPKGERGGRAAAVSVDIDAAAPADAIEAGRTTPKAASQPPPVSPAVLLAGTGNSAGSSGAGSGGSLRSPWPKPVVSAEQLSSLYTRARPWAAGALALCILLNLLRHQQGELSCRRGGCCRPHIPPRAACSLPQPTPAPPHTYPPPPLTLPPL